MGVLVTDSGSDRPDIAAAVVHCPYLGHAVTELWAGAAPVVAANVYLRSDANWSTSTVDGKARRLGVFFQFLAANDWSFWDDAVRAGGHRVALFRNALLRRCEAGDFGRSYARAIMQEVFQLASWWRQPGEPPLADTVTVEAGRSPHPDREKRVEQLPNAFNIKLRPEDRPKPHVMLESEVARVWAYLGKETAPKSPVDVVKNPVRPRAEWPEARKGRWVRARAQYAHRLAWHRRNRFLWALTLASGMRRDELPLLTLGDVRLYRGELWASLKVRREHRHLGKAKTGARLMFVGFDPRVQEAWDAYLQSRSVLVGGWIARSGCPDHGMLLVNRSGGPLTPKGLRHLLDEISTALGPFGDEGLGEAGFRLHPHALRHTIAALFDEWDVAPGVKQRHLGHRRMDTTQRYGKTFRTTYVATLRTFADRALGATAAGAA